MTKSESEPNAELIKALGGTPEEKRDYIEGKIAKALDVIRLASGMFPPKMLLGLMSGGNDSVPACYIASLHHRFDGILHVNTETGIEDTHQHVRRVCSERKWPLFERRPSEFVNGKGAPEPISYRDFVLQHGFPGTAQHNRMYNRLKERQLECFEREMGFKAKKGEFVIYISGVRSSESKRRRETTTDDNQILRKGRRVWVAAIKDWHRLDCLILRQYAGIPENPVSKKIGMSGECLCGAYAHPGELDMIAIHYPEKAAEIRELHREVKAKGFPWGWDQEPPKWWLQQQLTGQQSFDSELETASGDQFLCVSCNKKAVEFD